MRYETNTFQHSLLPNFPSKNKTAKKLVKIVENYCANKTCKSIFSK